MCCEILTGGDERIAAASFDCIVKDTGEKEDGEDNRVLPGGEVVFFNLPPVVDDSGDRGDIDEAMEALPVFSAHGPKDEGCWFAWTAAGVVYKMTCSPDGQWTQSACTTTCLLTSGMASGSQAYTCRITNGVGACESGGNCTL